MITSAVLCLALNIFHEARGEPLESQIAVAAVTLNRAEREGYPDDVCKVVFQPNQFEWTLDKSKKAVRANNLKDPIERKAFLKAKIIADLYLKKKIGNPVGSRVFFNHKSLGKKYKTPYKPIRYKNLVYY